MQLRKFYGRSLAGASTRVRQELGPDAFILETNAVQPGSATERMHPGARYEIIAAREAPEPAPAERLQHAAAKAAPTGKETAAEKIMRAMAEKSGVPYVAPRPAAPAATPYSSKSTVGATPQQNNSTKPTRNWALLHDLGELKAQLNELLLTTKTKGNALGTAGGAAGPAGSAVPAGIDLADYHALIAMGVRHDVLAPHFRAWLQWRTASPQLRQYLLGTPGNVAGAMQSTSLREWLLHSWTASEAGAASTELSNFLPPSFNQSTPQMVALVGPSGAGKTTTLAKLTSNIRREKRHKVGVVTLDTQRLGVGEQWRKMAALFDIEVYNFSQVNQISEVKSFSEKLDWVGIDTPSGFSPESFAGQAYGSLLAECPHMKTALVLPATQQEQASTHQMQMGKRMGATQVIFTKLDEARASGSLGSVVNLALGGLLPLAGLATGTRVPEDLAPANSANLWTHILAPAQARQPWAEAAL